MTASPLAAIRFDNADIDTFLAQTVATAEHLGLKVRGVLQSRGEDTDECHCRDMNLETLGSHRTFRISQSLGNGSRGCRLHPGSLAECAAFLEDELHQGADLLVLNRFGRGEAEGRGFRELIGTALALGLPVLMTVRPAYCDDWVAFSGDLRCDLPMNQEIVLKWLSAVTAARSAAE